LSDLVFGILDYVEHSKSATYEVDAFWFECHDNAIAQVLN